MRKSNTTTEEIFIASYPFLKDFELRAIVKKEDSHQEVEIAHLPSGDTNRIGCIHVAVSSLTLSEFNALQSNPNQQASLINAISSESHKEINLSAEEHFVALKSWTQGIAEAGLNAFKLQSDIDSAANFATPMINILCRFVYLHMPSLIVEYLSAIDRECKFNGKRHISSFVSNVLPILKTAFTICRHDEGNNTLIKHILSLQPPVELFSTLTSDDMQLLGSCMDTIAFTNLIYDSCCTEAIVDIIGAMKCIPTTPKFFHLFTSNDPAILEALASHPLLVSLPEYNALFLSPHHSVQLALARNDAAKKHPLFPTIFTFRVNKKGGKINFRLAMELASDPKNCAFPEYANLFHDAILNIAVAHEIAENESAPIAFPDLYKKLFAMVPDAVAKNRNAIHLIEEYRKLFQLPTEFVPKIGYPLTENKLSAYRNISLVKGASDLPEYHNLLQIDLTNGDWCDNGILDIFNLNAMEFAEFDKLLRIKDRRISPYFIDHPYLIYYPYCEQLLRNYACIYVNLTSPLFMYYPHVFADFLRDDSRFNYSLGELLQNPFVINFPNDVRRILSQSKSLCSDFAANPQAVFLPDLYRTLFQRKYCWEKIAANPNAVIFTTKFRHLFEKALTMFSSDAFDLSKFATNINAPVLFPHEFRKLFALADYDAMKSGSKYFNNSLILALITNPNAAIFPEYATLFKYVKDDDTHYMPQILRNYNAAIYHPSLFQNLLSTVFERVNNSYRHKYSVEVALQALALNHNAALYADFISNQINDNDDPDILTNYAMNPYLTNASQYRKIVFKYPNDYRTLTGAAANPNAIYCPEFSSLFHTIDCESKNDRYRVLEYTENSVAMGLAENPMMPILYPAVFEKILYSRVPTTRRYAFGNPNAFPLIFPHVLRRNRECMVNKNLAPIFFNHTWFYYRTRSVCSN